MYILKKYGDRHIFYVAVQKESNFWTEEKLEAHEVDCSQKNNCRIILPKNRWLEFEHFNRKEWVPVVVYADMECLIKPREEDQPERVVRNHQAFSIGYYVKYSFDDSLSKYESYRQLDETMQTPAAWFVDHLKTIAANMEEYLANIKPMELTRQDWEEYNAQDLCHICEKPFTRKDIKVRDHCHLTGRWVSNLSHTFINEIDLLFMILVWEVRHIRVVI